jgi:hypothetical protein
MHKLNAKNTQIMSTTNKNKVGQGKVWKEKAKRLCRYNFQATPFLSN